MLLQMEKSNLRKLWGLLLLDLYVLDIGYWGLNFIYIQDFLLSIKSGTVTVLRFAI